VNMVMNLWCRKIGEVLDQMSEAYNFKDSGGSELLLLFSYLFRIVSSASE
jgi:hypothetical protein